MQYIPQTSESIEQQNLFRWAGFAENKYPELSLMFHIPNEGKRSVTTGRRLKSEGMKKGVPDILLPVSRGGYHGLFIEMKVGKNKTTAEQKEWISNLIAEGYSAVVCYGWESAAKVLTDYLDQNSVI